MRDNGENFCIVWLRALRVGRGCSRGGGRVAEHLTAELIAVIVAVTAGEPRVLTIGRGSALPSGSFESGHRSLQYGTRSWVERQTHQPLGYVEQLYTFADRDRGGDGAGRVISVSYLGLARETQVSGEGAGWQSWYRFFPWEDVRHGPPPLIAQTIAPRLQAWADTPGRRQRAAINFGLDGRAWNEELVLQRYELLYEAGLVPERLRRPSEDMRQTQPCPALGEAMTLDHRRILATGIARLRTKIKYRPVFFELMPDSFTLLQLQHTVEALAGRRLHKQNFRRLIDQQRLVEETGQVISLPWRYPGGAGNRRHQAAAGPRRTVRLTRLLSPVCHLDRAYAHHQHKGGGR